MFLLSIKAGLRSKEIANLTWGMVTGDGKIADVIAVQNVASKGKNGGREIPVHPDLKAALVALQAHRDDLAMPERPVVHSERGPGVGQQPVWFHRLYEGLGMDGCSSHSGRRTFVTKAAHKIVEAGGSLRDVQQLAGHTSLATTQRYIEGSNDAKRKVADDLERGKVYWAGGTPPTPRATSHQVMHFYSGQWCTFTPALTCHL